MLPANDCLGKLKADLLVLLDTVVFPSDCIQQNLSLMLRCDFGQYSDRWEKKDFSANSSGRVPSAEQQISA